MQVCFDRQVQLANYFEAELGLMAHMCMGRSDNVAYWLSRSFPYPMLISCANNPYLPPSIRAAFIRFEAWLAAAAFASAVAAAASSAKASSAAAATVGVSVSLAHCCCCCFYYFIFFSIFFFLRLVIVFTRGHSFAKNLYLDRYPQMPHSGRASLPEQLWVYAARDLTNPNVQTLPVVNDQLKLDDDGSLPCFALPTSSPLFGHPDPLLGFAGHTKFFLMRHLGNTYLQSLGDGAIAHKARPTNELTLAVLSYVVSPLLDFGFQSTIAKVNKYTFVPSFVEIMYLF
jgi:hypothetical protein